MRTPKILASAVIVLFASPVAAQEVGGAIGPGPQGPEPGYYADGNGYYLTYRRDDFRPGRVVGNTVGGPTGAAGIIASSPFRALQGNDAYAMAPNASRCAQRYRSYDPASGTYLGSDGRRHWC